MPIDQGVLIIIKKLFKKIFGKHQDLHKNAIIIPREQHSISRSNISANALKVLYRLHEAGFSAYLVGGSVRDLLLGHAPKDFDVATNARPEQVKKLFRNCLLIGRRFRLAHIRFGHEIVEVATFRGSENKKSRKDRYAAEHGMLLRDNIYGTIEEDAWRRDFTINALYYNISDFSVVDYCGGMDDLKNKLIRIIGDPIKRYQEDPVRLLRTIRFAGKLNLTIHPETAKPIIDNAQLLQHVPIARLFDETLKLFHSGKATIICQLLQQYHLFTELFPSTAQYLNPEHPIAEKLLQICCQNTDIRINEGKSVSAGFLFACLLWYPMQQLTENYLKNNYLSYMAYHKAAQEVISKQTKHISIPKRFTQMVREIWDMQLRLSNPQKRFVIRLLNHPKFRAAYDFLLLRAQAGDVSQDIADWWLQFESGDDTARHQLLAKLPDTKKIRRRKKSK